MKILALEFSSNLKSVAVVADGEKRGMTVDSAAKIRPLEMVQKALAEAGMEREEIQCLAIGTGPGSYTGIRMAIALAQGWQLARPVQLLGISSVEVMAERARAEGCHGRVNVIVDAQRDELYLARYDISHEAVREAEPMRIVPTETAGELLKTGEIVAGPEAPRWFAGALELHPDAATIGRLAWGRTDFLPGEQLEPIYLREVSFVKAPPPRLILE